MFSTKSTANLADRLEITVDERLCIAYVRNFLLRLTIRKITMRPHPSLVEIGHGTQSTQVIV